MRPGSSRDVTIGLQVVVEYPIDGMLPVPAALSAGLAPGRSGIAKARGQQASWRIIGTKSWLIQRLSVAGLMVQ